MSLLVDSSVLLDVVTRDPRWFDWSSSTIASCVEREALRINPIIYAEVSLAFKSIEELEEAIPPAYFHRTPLPWEAAFLAARCFLQYRRRGGDRRSPLPDFYIGAHASVEGMGLITRDAARTRTYFPRLRIISPA